MIIDHLSHNCIVPWERLNYNMHYRGELVPRELFLVLNLFVNLNFLFTTKHAWCCA